MGLKLLSQVALVATGLLAPVLARAQDASAQTYPTQSSPIPNPSSVASFKLGVEEGTVRRQVRELRNTEEAQQVRALFNQEVKPVLDQIKNMYPAFDYRIMDQTSRYIVTTNVVTGGFDCVKFIVSPRGTGTDPNKVVMFSSNYNDFNKRISGQDNVMKYLGVLIGSGAGRISSALPAPGRYQEVQTFNCH